MWVLLRFLSLRYWLRHRGAFLLSTLGVTLGLAVFVAIQVANHSVLASFETSLNAVTGKANLQIVGGQSGLPDETFARIIRSSQPELRDNIQAAAPLLSKTLYSPTLKSSLLVRGVDLFSEDDFRDYHWGDENAGVANSRAAQDGTDQQGLGRFLLDPKAIAISQSLAQRHNLKRGDTIQLFVGAKRFNFKINTLLGSEQTQNAFGGDFALLDIATAQETFGEIGRLSQIDLLVEETQIPAVSAALQPLLPRDAQVQRPAQRGEQVTGLLSAFQLNLSALSCIALFVGAFLIYNAIAIAVVRRRSEVGTLRAVGASRQQIVTLFLIEAAAIGFIGSLLGILLGLTLARFALEAVSTTVSSLYLAVRAREIFFPIWLLWAAPLGGTMLSVLASLPAALEAAGTSPRAATQRATLHHAATKFAFPMALAGLASLLLAFILCLPFLSRQTPLFGFAAAFLLLGGFALLSPIFTLWAGRVSQKLCGKLFGIEGALAGSYLQRALGRSSLVIAALMVSLAMTVGMNVMVGSFRQTVANWVETTISADLYIAPSAGFSGEYGTGLPAEVIQYARSIPNLRGVDTIRNVETQIGNQPVLIAANELPTLQNGLRTLRFVETESSTHEALQSYSDGRGILVSERFKNLLGFGAGSSVEIMTPQGPQNFHIAGVFYDYTPNECLIYMARPLYQKIWNDNAIDGIALYLPSQNAIDEVKRDLENRFAQQYQLTLLPNRELRESVFKIFDQTFAVTYALQLIAVFVAAIGAFDTLIALLLERSRETAMLRALGASSTQLLKTTMVEFALIAIFAWMLGLAAGLLLAWQLISVINRQFFGWTIDWSLPLSVPLSALALSLLASLGAGILPALAATKRPLAESLQTE